MEGGMVIGQAIKPGSGSKLPPSSPAEMKQRSAEFAQRRINRAAKTLQRVYRGHFARVHVDNAVDPGKEPPKPAGTHTTVILGSGAHLDQHLAELLAYKALSEKQRLDLLSLMTRVRHRVDPSLKTYVFARKPVDLGKKKEFNNKLLVQYEEQMKDPDDWKKRKVAVDNYVDLVMELMMKDRENQDVQTWGYKCLEGHINPLMEDSSWWVRKAVVGSCLRFAKENGTRVRSIVQEKMVSGSNFSGRFAAVQTSLKITKAMSGEDEGRGVLMDILYRALVDEHWVVRQAAYDGLIDITPDDSDEPAQRAFEMLKDERAPIRRIAIDLLKKFMKPKNKHDMLSNQVLSSKAIVTGFANKAMYEKLDADNNCRVNAEEIKHGFRKFANIDIGLERTFDFLGPENRDGDLSYDEFMNLLRSGHDAKKPEQDTPIQVCSDLLEQLIDQLPDKEEESLVRLSALRHAYATEHERFCREALLECLFDMTPLGDRDWPFLVQSCLRDVNPNIFKTATKNLQAYIDDVGDAILNGSVHVLVDLDALQDTEGDEETRFMSPEESEIMFQDSVISVVSSTWSQAGDEQVQSAAHRPPEVRHLEEQPSSSEHPPPEASLEEDCLDPEHPDPKQPSAHIGDAVHHPLLPPPPPATVWPLEEAALKRAARVRFFERKWDLLSCFAGQLVNASNDVRIESLGFVDRFWDKGVATAALKKQCKGLQASLQVKKNEFVETFDKELRQKEYEETGTTSRTKSQEGPGTNWDDLKQYPDSACSASSLKLRQAARELEKDLKEKSGELKHCSRLDTTILLAVQQMVNYKKEDPRVQQSAISLWGSIKHLVPDQKKKAHGHKTHDRKVRSGSQ